MKNRSRPKREVLGYFLEQYLHGSWENVLDTTTLDKVNKVFNKKNSKNMRIRKVVSETPRKLWPKLEENTNE